MLSVPIYSPTGERLGEESIDPADFGGEVNKQLLHDVVLMHQANRRVGTVNTRGRSDVAGSTRKMYRQKGTGNARMGSKRTNKRVGGGVAFARRNRDYSYAMPKKAIRAAVRMAVLSKFQDGQAIIIDGLAAPGDGKPKTKHVVSTLRAIQRPDLNPEAAKPVEGETKVAARRRQMEGATILLGLAEYDKGLYLSARNIEGVAIAPISEFNTYDVLRQRYLVLTPESLAALKAWAASPSSRKAPEPEPVAATA